MPDYILNNLLRLSVGTIGLGILTILALFTVDSAFSTFKAGGVSRPIFDRFISAGFTCLFGGILLGLISILSGLALGILFNGDV